MVFGVLLRHIVNRFDIVYNKKMENKHIIVCRGLIIDNDKILLVENSKNNFFCLPGGKMDAGENPQQAIIREIEEELGIKPEIGRLLYVFTYKRDQDQAIEFIYEILNVADYRDVENLKGTHSFELSKIVWLDKNSTEKILPSEMWQDFKENNLPQDKEHYINS